MSRTYTEQMQHIVGQYIMAGEQWPASARQIASWAVSNNLWAPPRAAIVDRCAEDLARAMREEYITDPQGRSVRAKHAAWYDQGAKQMVLWADIRTASRQHMQIAFQQRRQQIVGDCRQLKTDVDSYNENSQTQPPIQMSFDFTDDLLELEAIGF